MCRSPVEAMNELRERCLRGNKPELYFFWGHTPTSDGRITKSCLSQWWQSPFWKNDVEYCCMEQYMMAGKARLFGDSEILAEILSENRPDAIKKLGRRVRNFDSDVWKAHKYDIVVEGNLCKFSQNPGLREFLLSTGNSILVEASPFDCIWGIGLKESDPRAQDPLQWKGQNLLGFALTEVRSHL